jgi:hypothetical protein
MIVTECTVPGCSTLTIGPLCLEHDDVQFTATRSRGVGDNFPRQSRMRRVKTRDVHGGAAKSALGVAPPPRSAVD